MLDPKDRNALLVWGGLALLVWHTLRDCNWRKAIIYFLACCFILQNIERCQSLFRSDEANAKIIARNNNMQQLEAWESLVAQIKYASARLYIPSDRRKDYKHIFDLELEYSMLHDDYPNDGDLSYNLAVVLFNKGECKEARELWKTAKRQGHKPSEEMLEAMWRVDGRGWWKRCDE